MGNFDSSGLISCTLILKCMLLLVLARKGMTNVSSDTAKMNTAELVRYWGYQCETHEVTTQDGYILKQHRIVKGKGRPVIVQHGLFASSDFWVVQGPKKDLAFLLADAGYDVWLTNTRGNTYGRGHVNISTSNLKFWDFSWHEMGYYDMPAIVDYVLKTTGFDKTFYVGHSMGTTMFYVFASTRPEYNSKIQLSSSLAPIAYFYHVPLYPIMEPFVNNFHDIGLEMKKQGALDIFAKEATISEFATELCNRKTFEPLCFALINVMVGNDPDELSHDMFLRILQHFPAGSSLKTVHHYAQCVATGEFHNWTNSCKMDLSSSMLPIWTPTFTSFTRKPWWTGDFAMFSYGKTMNLQYYGTEKAPRYNVSLITAPVALHYATNDAFASPLDVERLAKQLPNLVGKFKVPFWKFNHGDFGWARDARGLLYEPLLSLFNKYNSTS